jgi:hypothetical protein
VLSGGVLVLVDQPTENVNPFDRCTPGWAGAAALSLRIGSAGAPDRVPKRIGTENRSKDPRTEGCGAHLWRRHWNSANTVLYYGKESELTGADREHQEVSMLALHLLQSALVYLNTLLIQRVVAERSWATRLTGEDRRGLSPLFWTHVNPYGRFTLDMGTHLDLAA